MTNHRLKSQHAPIIPIHTQSHIYIYLDNTHTHTYIHTHIHTHIHIHTYTHTDIHTHAHSQNRKFNITVYTYSTHTHNYRENIPQRPIMRSSHILKKLANILVSGLPVSRSYMSSPRSDLYSPHTV